MQEAVVTDLGECFFTVKIPVTLFSAFVLSQTFSTKNVMEMNLLGFTCTGTNREMKEPY